MRNYAFEREICVNAISYLCEAPPRNLEDREVWMSSAAYWLREFAKLPVNQSRPDQAWALHGRLAHALAGYDQIPLDVAFECINQRIRNPKDIALLEAMWRLPPRDERQRVVA
jgi:hypothetical protein